MSLSRWLSYVLLAVSVAASGFYPGVLHAEPQQYVQPELENRIMAGEQVDLLVHFNGMPDLSFAYDLDWETRGQAVYDVMQPVVAKTQSPVKERFDRMGVRYESLWVGNMMIVHKAERQAFNQLTQSPSVKAVFELPDFRMFQNTGDSGVTPLSSHAGPNIAQIQADQVWQQLGIRGEDIVVGLNDSSPRYTHEALVNQYRGNNGDGSFNHDYNWFDPNGGTSAPVGEAHGTHVLGTMVGDDGDTNGIGVAPGSKWMACGGCAGGSCAGVLQCLNWMTAPTDRDGLNPDPSLRAHIVNNSWGDCAQSYQDSATYEPIWDTMYAAGVIPIFANGNASNCGYSSPPGPNTVGQPARSGRVIGVGSTTETGGNYAPHSNWGPTDNNNPGLPNSFDHFGFPDIKPNISAPGQAITSAAHDSDTGYAGGATWTGTSMSSPAASGVAALMVSAAPCLIGDQVRIGTILMETAVPIDYDSGVGGEGTDNHPNYATGWGEVNALAAVQAAMQECGPSGTLAGTVTDGGGLPVPNVTVTVDNPEPPPDEWVAFTDESGEYSQNLPVGTFDVTFSAYGYDSQTFPANDISENQTTTLDVTLNELNSFEVSGTVTDSVTGWPVHAEIVVDGVPNGTIYSDPATGSYSISLVEGQSYDFEVTPITSGYEADTVVVGPVTGDMTENLTLAPDLGACTAPGYEAQVVYSEDFDANDGGYTGDNDWAWGAPTGAFPGDCPAGANCWGTNLGGDYSPSTTSELVSSAIDLSSATPGDTLVLTWWQANHIETSNWDQGSVEISYDGGTNWTELWANPASTVAEEWREMSADISDGAGASDVRLRATVTGDGSFQFPGLYLDDVTVLNTGACAAQSGERLTGRVLDANTGMPLNGVTVEVQGGGSTTSGPSSDPSIGDGAYVLFVPEGAQNVVAQGSNGYENATLSDTFVDGDARSHNFSLEAPRFSITPNALSETLENGTSVVKAAFLVNEGAATGFDVLAESLALAADFEGSVPPSGWDVANNGGDCVWQRNDEVGRANVAGGDGFSAAADSDACGSGTTMDTSLITPTINLSALSNPELSFVLSYRHLGSSSLEVNISVDGGDTWDSLAAYTASVDGTGPGAPQVIDLSAYAAATEALIEFRYQSGWDWWAQVDQIQVTGGADWLSVTPGTGTLIESAALEVTMDASAASVVDPGVYQGRLVLDAVTPYEETVVPVTMTVEPSSSEARLEGTVNGLGYCGANETAAAGASVEVIGQTTTQTLTADANGEYGVWLDVSEAPLAITVSASGHLDRTIAGVQLAGGETTTRDFGLRQTTPCPNLTPQFVQLDAVPGTTVSANITVSNSGAAAFDWVWDASSEGPLFDIVNQSSEGDSGIVSTRFSGLDPVTGAYSADDFQVNGDSIVEVTAYGFTGAGNPTVDSLATEIGVYIYEDADGIPAGHPEGGDNPAVFSFEADPSDPAFSYTDSVITLDVVAANAGEALSLPSGDYWLVVSATVPGTESDPRWNWFASLEPAGVDAQIITPGAAFGNGFPEWASIADGVDTIFAGLAMTLSGQISCGADWLTLTPDTGTVAADGAMSVALEVDATNLTEGVYSANVCIETDDPEQPWIVGELVVSVGETIFSDRFEVIP